MRLYIPSLGDRITLEKDWVFHLHHEGRNETLGDKLGVFAFHGHEVEDWQYVKLDPPREIQSQDCYGKPYNYTQTHEHKIVGMKPVKTWKDARLSQAYQYDPGRVPYGGFEDCRNACVVTLPIGTVLRIDRIYIRKGQDDFNSITFVAESIPGIKCDKVPNAVKAFEKKGTKGIARFWAKLKDVNNIEFRENL